MRSLCRPSVVYARRSILVVQSEIGPIEGEEGGGHAPHPTVILTPTLACTTQTCSHTDKLWIRQTNMIILVYSIIVAIRTMMEMIVKILRLKQKCYLQQKISFYNNIERFVNIQSCRKKEHGNRLQTPKPAWNMNNRHYLCSITLFLL